MARFLVVVSSGEKPKSLLALRWAAAALSNGWADDVDVVFFGPAEDFLARGDPDFYEAIKALQSQGKEPIACERFAQAAGYLDTLAKRGIRTGYVGEIIARKTAEGYTPLVF